MHHQKKKDVALSRIAAVMLTLACQMRVAYSTEKTQSLGVVNGQVRENQVVEVTRSLADPVLYLMNSPDFLPQTLRIRNATIRSADDGAVWVTLSQSLAGCQRSVTITLRVSLWVDGKQVPAVYSRQGVDVLFHSILAQQQVMLRSDSPAILQAPVNCRGAVSVAMETAGE